MDLIPIPADLELPRTWACSVRDDWAVLAWAANGGELPPANQTVFRRPDKLQLNVSIPMDDGTKPELALLFRFTDAIELVGAMAFAEGNFEALWRKASAYSASWWCRKALVEWQRDEYGFLVGIAQTHEDAEFEAILRDTMGQRIATAASAATRRRYEPISEERLDRVAEVYIAAGDNSPTKAVSATLNVGYSHAAHLVSKARAAGKLPAYKRPSGRNNG